MKRNSPIIKVKRVIFIQIFNILNQGFNTESLERYKDLNILGNIEVKNFNSSHIYLQKGS